VDEAEWSNAVMFWRQCLFYSSMNCRPGTPDLSGSAWREERFCRMNPAFRTGVDSWLCGVIVEFWRLPLPYFL
jgi:hypothetical protein